MSLLALTFPAVKVSENFTMYPIIPSDAAQGWRLELFDCRQIVPHHYHKIRRQYVLVTEGCLEAFHGKEKPIMMPKGAIICYDPGMVHTLIPRDSSQFLVIDLPGYQFPDDVYLDEVAEPKAWIPTPINPAPPLDSKYFGDPIKKGDYSVYDLITGETTGHKWSTTLIDIQNSPRHMRKIEMGHFIVVHGTLDIEIDGETQIVPFGGLITIHPGSTYQLRSATDECVRVLSFSFPASLSPTESGLN